MLYLQMSSVDEGSSKSDDIDGSKLLRITSSAIINICICKQLTPIVTFLVSHFLILYLSFLF